MKAKISKSQLKCLILESVKKVMNEISLSNYDNPSVRGGFLDGDEFSNDGVEIEPSVSPEFDAEENRWGELVDMRNRGLLSQEELDAIGEKLGLNENIVQNPIIQQNVGVTIKRIFVDNYRYFRSIFESDEVANLVIENLRKAISEDVANYKTSHIDLQYWVDYNFESMANFEITEIKIAHGYAYVRVEFISTAG